MTPEQLQQAFVAALQEADKSSSIFTLRDVLLLVAIEIFAIVAVLVVIGWFVYRYMTRKNSGQLPFPGGVAKDNALANKAHGIIVDEGKDAFAIITRTDDYGTPVIYGMAQAAKDIAKGILSLDEKMTHLFNHQSQLWKDHDNDIKSLKRDAAIRRRQGSKG